MKKEKQHQEHSQKPLAIHDLDANQILARKRQRQLHTNTSFSFGFVLVLTTSVAMMRCWTNAFFIGRNHVDSSQGRRLRCYRQNDSRHCSRPSVTATSQQLLRPLQLAVDSRELRFLRTDNTLFRISAFRNMLESLAADNFSSAILEPAIYSTIVTTTSNHGHVGLDHKGVQYFRRTSVTNSREERGQSTMTLSPLPLTALRQDVLTRPSREGFGHSIHLTDEEKNLFNLLRQVRSETDLSTTLRVAGGWVRDKLLAIPEFKAHHTVIRGGNSRHRLSSKFRKYAPSLGRQGTKVLVSPTATNDACQPVDIDVALDDMLGREFADHLNKYLLSRGENTVSVGVVLKNPEKSKHLETATMKVGPFWIDFVNLRAEEYTQDSRIPDLMRIGTAREDAFRRDLTINSLFYNVNTGQVEDWTGKGLDDLRKGIIATPLPALTTLLDDPLRVLRSIRFAARLRFSMDEELVDAAKDRRVRNALALKVSRERVGGELDLMLRSPDPVGAVRLLINLQLAGTVFPMQAYLDNIIGVSVVHNKGLALLSTCHDHLADCRLSPPLWCLVKTSIYGTEERRLIEDEEARRLLWYASFLKPFYDHCKLEATKMSSRRQSRKVNQNAITKLLINDLKRPTRDAQAVERIMKAADEFTHLLSSGCDISATMILLSDVLIMNDYSNDGGHFGDIASIVCSMNGRIVDSAMEEDPVWEHAMEFRLLCSQTIKRIGPLWRAALLLSLAEQLASLEGNLEYAIEGDTVNESQEERRQGIVERYDVFATALQRIGLIGIWNEKPLLDGGQLKRLFPNMPIGPVFREVMDEQSRWMTSHPGTDKETVSSFLRDKYPDFC